jgi:hypothetical protein
MSVPVFNLASNTHDTIDVTDIYKSIIYNADFSLRDAIRSQLIGDVIMLGRYNLDADYSVAERRRIILTLTSIFVYNNQSWTVMFGDQKIGEIRALNSDNDDLISAKIADCFIEHYPGLEQPINPKWVIFNDVIIVTLSKKLIRIDNEYVLADDLRDVVNRGEWNQDIVGVVDASGAPVNDLDGRDLQYTALSRDKIPVYGVLRSGIRKRLVIDANNWNHPEYDWACENRHYPVMPFSTLKLGGYDRTIFVKSITGLNYTLKLSSDDTIEHLKQKAFEKTQMPIDQQRLIFAGGLLKNELTLADYKIGDESMIHMVLNLRGGGYFADVTTEMKTAKLGSDGDEWCRVAPGINVHGECHNPKCSVFMEEVIKPQIGNTYDIADECNCPICDEPFTPSTCGFYKCDWKYDGVTATGNKLSSPWQHVDDDYKYFDKRAKIDYKYLVISVKRNSEYPGDDCCICLEKMQSSVSRISCGHAYHKCCIEKWLAKSNTCPYCRETQAS